ncbi:MAG: MBL fold metallo-hydrolase [Alphaproteobacteria bacterium]|nr:MAG: MBL fold metallo-hydrolase [Alphaproteobacteria bacterium]
MIFQQLFDPVSCTYTYLLARRHGGEAVIIDPVLEHVETYLGLLERLDLRLLKAIDTHIHADHVTGLAELRDHTKCITVMGERSGADVVSMRVKEDEVIDVDGVKMRTLYTPGHTDDSYSFVMDDRVFTGDALLIGGTGRTDFQNGDPRAAYDSLFNKLLRLPEETMVFPAHDYNGNTASTIGFERAHNPRLQVSSPDEYAEIMNNLKLPNPKMMDVAVPANKAVGKTLQKYVRPGEALTVEQCRKAAQQSGIVLIDLREKHERERDGWIPESLHVPYEELEEHLFESGVLRRIAEDHPDGLILYCAHGERSALALDTMRDSGIGGVKHLAGGLKAWRDAGGELAHH